MLEIGFDSFFVYLAQRIWLSSVCAAADGRSRKPKSVRSPSDSANLFFKHAPIQRTC